MEHFIVSARKYRPTTFKSVVGQQAITNTLENAIANNHLAQALLFTGPRGVGKTTCARILAKRINQESTENLNEDFAFNIFELDAASNNSVDDIRNLTDQVRIPPQTGKYKVYIIDEVHMLSQAAFNAFLKTLEEPPNHAIFILATTEKHKIIPTILSRCQIFDFKRITVTDIKNHLAEIAQVENIDAEDDALHIIAQKADGALRDALSIFDRVVSFSGKNLTRQAVTENLNVLDYTTYFETTDFLLNNDIPGSLVLFDAILAKGFDGHHFISGLASHFRDLLVCKHQSTITLLEVGEQIKTSYFEQSQKASSEFLQKALEIANDCDLKYKTSKNQRLLVELCLMQLASITYTDEKKKLKRYIQPPQTRVTPSKPVKSQENKTEPKQYSVDDEKTQQSKNIAVAESENISEESSTPETPKNSIPERNAQRISALSLKSIQQKKHLQEQLKGKKVVQEQLPEDQFSETDLQIAWKEYARILEKKGEHIVASHLDMVLPTVEENNIHVSYPNETIKVELERSQQYLLNFLSKKLNNHNLQLIIEVNENHQKNYVYTAREKYEKLKEKYPVIETLKKTFDLDV
ncbi:DNA polymerase III subunit gamma/tau [Planktosalinus lacus]|uniref:DNA polymerase III subunit gamma/tau n=1 Tax=Planktosalinus lacus TaxID=1526573 RepID=A0A8J2VCF4_9FLAO|nr:DNA polymerase III subunit gamma/tau [Planktosalinus lacus]GGD98108.1 hypothetical protein GCM10011312_22110 [Planktosalinus lacus]